MLVSETQISGHVISPQSHILYNRDFFNVTGRRTILSRFKKMVPPEQNIPIMDVILLEAEPNDFYGGGVELLFRGFKLKCYCIFRK